MTRATSKMLGFLTTLFLMMSQPVSAQGVIAHATVSRATPAVGDTITVGIDLNLSATTELLGAYSASLQWNPAVLAFITTSGGSTSGFDHPGTNTSNVATGSLRFNQFNVQGATGVVNVVNITFKVVGKKGDASVLDLGFSALDAAVTFTNLLPVTTSIDGVVQILGPLRGDVNRNGSITAFDAILILRYLVGLDEGNTVSLPPTARDFSLATADVNQNGRISPLDAALIFQLDAGIIAAFPTASSSKPVLLGERTMTVSDPQYADGTVVVPVRLSDLSGVVAGEMTLTYDPALFEIVKVMPTEKLSGWQVASNIQAGQLKIALAGAQGGTGAGDLFWVELRLLNNQRLIDNPLTITEVILNDGAIKIVVQPNLPKTYTLFQNIPNPFNPVTQISFDLPQAGHAVLVVYNLTGQVIRTLVNEERPTGRHSIIWDGRDEYGREVASGIYLYRLTTGTFTATKKMVLIR